MLKLLSEFYVGNNKYCIVQVGKNKNVSVMPEEEYKLIWGRYNYNKWKKEKAEKRKVYDIFGNLIEYKVMVMKR